MSREQKAIADFSAFLMQWLSDPKNNDLISDAVAKAIKIYSVERQMPGVALSDFFPLNSDSEIHAFEQFSKEEFYQLCELLEQHYNQQQTSAVIKRILIIQNEYKHSIKLIENKMTDKVDASQCENWRRVEFSKQEIEQLKSHLQGRPASAFLLPKLISEFPDEEGAGWQFYLEKAKKIVVQVGEAARKAAAAAHTLAVNLTTINTAAFFSNASLASPNSREFLLSIDSRTGSWEEMSSGLSDRASLKTRIIHEVCDAYFQAKLIHSECLTDDDFLNISDQAVELKEQSKSTRSLYSFSVNDPQEVKVLQHYAEKIISPLKKSGHALQIYQSLLAIDSDMKRMQRLLTPAEKRKVVAMVETTRPEHSKASLAAPPARPSRHDDDDDFSDDNRRSAANFTTSNVGPNFR